MKLHVGRKGEDEGTESVMDLDVVFLVEVLRESNYCLVRGLGLVLRLVAEVRPRSTAGLKFEEVPLIVHMFSFGELVPPFC